MKKMINFLTKKKHYDLLALLLTAFILMLSFSIANRLFFSKYTILIGDLYAQYIPLYRMFIHKIFLGNDLFDKGSLFYSFTVGYGQDISAYITKEALLSPFNLIFLLIKDDNIAAIILIFSKLSFAAFFFQRYLARVHKIDGIKSCAYSLMYSLCGYCTIYYINVQYLEGLIYLPIIVTLCHEMIAYKTNGVKLAFVYMLSFVNSFYSGYIVGIYSFLFFLICLLFSDNKEKLRLFVKYIRSVIIAVLLSSVFILPTINSIFSKRVSDETVYDGTVAGIFQTLSNMFIGMTQGYKGTIPYFYCGIVVFLAIPLFFLNYNISKKRKMLWGILLVFLTLCTFVPFLYIAMHGFDNPDMFVYRFTYLASFTIISMIAITLEKAFIKEKKIIIILAMIFIAFATYLRESNQYPYINGLTYYLSILFGLLYAILLYVKDEKKYIRNYFIPGFIVLEIFLNLCIILVNAEYLPVNYKSDFNCAESGLAQAINDIVDNDKGFYRVNIPNALSLDYHMEKNLCRGQFFGSNEDENVRNTVHNLGMLTSARLMTDYGINDATEMLLGYKYNIFSNGIIVDNDITSPLIEENNYFLGIGYMSNSGIQDLYFETDNNAFININRTLSAATGEQIEYFINANTDINIMAEQFAKIEYDTGYVQYLLNDNIDYGEIKYSFEGEEQYYAYVPGIVESAYYDTAPVLYSLNGDDRILTLEQCVFSPKIVKLGKDSGLNNLCVRVPGFSEYNYFVYKDIFIYKSNEEELEKAYNNLKDDTFIVDKFDDGYILGQCVATIEHDTLFFSVACDDFWDLYVDGERKDIVPALNGTYISCTLEPGSHSFELKYNNPFVWYGLVLSIIGIGWVSVIALRDKHIFINNCIN